MSALFFSSQRGNSFTGVRDSVYSGTWYPIDQQELSRDIDAYLDSAEIPEIYGRVVGLVSPHAGYKYSAAVSAHAYKSVRNMKVDVVILMGNAHREVFHGVAIDNFHAYQTPLGTVEIDSDLGRALYEAEPSIHIDSGPHQKEHSLEIQLPFLQRTLQSGFKILPLLFGHESTQAEQSIIKVLPELLKDKNCLLVASTDLTHYPSYSDAKLIDEATVEIISTMDAESLLQHESREMTKGITNLACVLCASSATRTVMSLSKIMGADHGCKMKYANSGDIVAADRSQVVGYAAIAFIRENDDGAQTEQRADRLDAEEQDKILKYSRELLTSYVNNEKIPEYDKSDRISKIYRGVFVTLHKHEDLRGCIGYIDPISTCMEAVRENTISACSRDPRFSPVKSDELKDISIEISVLTPPVSIDSWKDIELGKHGIILQKGAYKSVFLPQVAPEQGWDIETTLMYLALKAGLSAEQWLDASYKVFEAQVFSEKEDLK